jgi:hypothetical protein
MNNVDFTKDALEVGGKEHDDITLHPTELVEKRDSYDNATINDRKNMRSPVASSVGASSDDDDDDESSVSSSVSSSIESVSSASDSTSSRSFDSGTGTSSSRRSSLSASLSDLGDMSSSSSEGSSGESEDDDDGIMLRRRATSLATPNSLGSLGRSYSFDWNQGLSQLRADDLENHAGYASPYSFSVASFGDGGSFARLSHGAHPLEYQSGAASVLSGRSGQSLRSYDRHSILSMNRSELVAEAGVVVPTLAVSWRGTSVEGSPQMSQLNGQETSHDFSSVFNNTVENSGGDQTHIARAIDILEQTQFAAKGLAHLSSSDSQAVSVKHDSLEVMVAVEPEIKALSEPLLSVTTAPPPPNDDLAGPLLSSLPRVAAGKKSVKFKQQPVPSPRKSSGITAQTMMSYLKARKTMSTYGIPSFSRYSAPQSLSNGDLAFLKYASSSDNPKIAELAEIAVLNQQYLDLRTYLASIAHTRLARSQKLVWDLLLESKSQINAHHLIIERLRELVQESYSVPKISRILAMKEKSVVSNEVGDSSLKKTLQNLKDPREFFKSALVKINELFAANKVHGPESIESSILSKVFHDEKEPAETLYSDVESDNSENADSDDNVSLATSKTSTTRVTTRLPSSLDRSSSTQGKKRKRKRNSHYTDSRSRHRKMKQKLLMQQTLEDQNAFQSARRSLEDQNPSVVTPSRFFHPDYASEQHAAILMSKMIE